MPSHRVSSDTAAFWGEGGGRLTLSALSPSRRSASLSTGDEASSCTSTFISDSCTRSLVSPVPARFSDSHLLTFSLDPACAGSSPIITLPVDLSGAGLCAPPPPLPIWICPSAEAFSPLHSLNPLKRPLRCSEGFENQGAGLWLWGWGVWALADWGLGPRF